MFIKSLAFCCWLNCVAWSDLAVCSDECKVKMYIFQLLAFWCSLFWRCLSHDAMLDSEKLLIFISCLTILLLYCIDVILMLWTLFWILSLLSKSVSFSRMLFVEDVNFIIILCSVELQELIHSTSTLLSSFLCVDWLLCRIFLTFM